MAQYFYTDAGYRYASASGFSIRLWIYTELDDCHILCSHFAHQAVIQTVYWHLYGGGTDGSVYQ